MSNLLQNLLRTLPKGPLVFCKQTCLDIKLHATYLKRHKTGPCNPPWFPVRIITSIHLSCCQLREAWIRQVDGIWVEAKADLDKKRVVVGADIISSSQGTVQPNAGSSWRSVGTDPACIWLAMHTDLSLASVGKHFGACNRPSCGIVCACRLEQLDQGRRPAGTCSVCSECRCSSRNWCLLCAHRKDVSRTWSGQLFSCCLGSNQPMVTRVHATNRSLQRDTRAEAQGSIMKARSSCAIKLGVRPANAAAAHLEVELRIFSSDAALDGEAIGWQQICLAA